MQKQSKIVIVGCGTIATTHVDVLQKLKKNIVAVCDIDESKARKLCEKFGLNVKIYTDYIKMLDVEKPDAAHILTPHFLHAEMVVETLNRNINCLCEKPLFIKEDEFLQIQKAVSASKGKLGVCFQHRFMEINKFIKKCINEEGCLGISAFLAWRRTPEYYTNSSWRGKWKTEGGSLLINQAIHTLDQIIWLCGMPQKVIANTYNRTLADVIECEDTAELFLQYDNGVRCQMYATNAAATNFNNCICVRTNLNTYEFNSKQLLVNGVPYTCFSSNVSVDAKQYWGNGHYFLIDEFYRCVESGKTFDVDCVQASQAVKVVLSAYKSNGKEIEL